MQAWGWDGTEKIRKLLVEKVIWTGTWDRWTPETIAERQGNVEVGRKPTN